MASKKNHGVWIAPDGRARIAYSAAEAVKYQFDGWRLKPPHTEPPEDADQADEPDDGAEVTTTAAAKKTRAKTTDK